mgnify:CR=1 FL=1
MIEVRYQGQPIPASLHTGRERGYRTEAYREYVRALALLIREQAGPPDPDQTGLYEVTIKLTSPKGDIDNLTKPVLDAAKGIIWKDDSQVAHLDVWLFRTGEPRVYFTIDEISRIEKQEEA